MSRDLSKPPTDSNPSGTLTNLLREKLQCPMSGEPLRLSADGLTLRSANGRSYPIIEGVPVLLPDEVDHTHIRHTRQTQERVAGQLQRAKSEAEPERAGPVDPYVQRCIVETNGQLYRNLIGRLTRYPIPNFRLRPAEPDELLLDMGCNWGRWCVAAAKTGFVTVGIDPSIDAVLAAMRVARDLGVADRTAFVVGDARYLPFCHGQFGTVFSYSVLQHFSRDDARAALRAAQRVTAPGGRVCVQMANATSVRSFYHLARRGFREGEGFAVRYWTTGKLRRTFEELIGPTELTVDGYFGLGIQPSDADMLRPLYRAVVRVSEVLRRISHRVKPLRHLADSVYLEARKTT